VRVNTRAQIDRCPKRSKNKRHSRAERPGANRTIVQIGIVSALFDRRTARQRDCETARLLDCDFAFLENVFSAGATFAAATKATAIAHTHWHLASPIHPQTATHTGAVREREH